MALPTLTSAGYLWPCGPNGKPGVTCASQFSPTGTEAAPVHTPVLNPSVGRIRATWWDNSSSYHGLQAGMAKTMSHGFCHPGLKAVIRGAVIPPGRTNPTDTGVENRGVYGSGLRAGW